MAGPMGGLAQNVKCSNCGSEFNVSPVRSHRIPIQEPTNEIVRKSLTGITILKGEYSGKTGRIIKQLFSPERKKIRVFVPETRGEEIYVELTENDFEYLEFTIIRRKNHERKKSRTNTRRKTEGNQAG